jgi:tRNA 2-thiouridine synthesizing protein E
MQDNLTDQEMAERVLGLHNNDVPDWHIDKAIKLANAEGIKLTDEHIDVIQFLREAYEKHGPFRHARSLTQALEAKYAEKGGLKYLYQLFPNGPVTQGCNLAGIEEPSDSVNASFGTSV